MRSYKIILFSFLIFQICANAQTTKNDDAQILIFLSTIHDDQGVREAAIEYFYKEWSDEYVAPIVDLIYLAPKRSMQRDLYTLLESKIPDEIKRHPFEWWQYLWDKPAMYPTYYSKFKGRLYSGIDNRFQRYFVGADRKESIRLDEILWGGVEQDGIPPLSDPELLESHEADYLSKNDLVFGIVVNGIAKAYPKRILAWHEMVIDNFGDKRITGVYCTLCGTMIAYDSKIGDRHFDFGTSGFLYRSNKLMYDKQTQSLWNTIEGKPVVGTILNDNLNLSAYPVVTTTWKEWKKKYPNTKVLSLNTGHLRDYGTGVAYKEYFSVDDLMFPVPNIDYQLDNKEEMIVLKTPSSKADPLAISRSFLRKNRVFHFDVNKENYVALTDRKGGVFVFESKTYTFEHWTDKGVIDAQNEIWSFDSDFLISDRTKIKLNRIPTHSIFWFAWYNTYPDTRLIK